MSLRSWRVYAGAGVLFIGQPDGDKTIALSSVTRWEHALLPWRAEWPTPLAMPSRRPTIMIDCSHGNSLKDHQRQPEVAASICEQVASGSWQIFGTMIESHLVEGRQDYVAGVDARHGQSITDACLSFEDTEPILERLARAQQARGKLP